MNGLTANFRLPDSGNTVAACTICGSYPKCRCDEIDKEEDEYDDEEVDSDEEDSG